MEAIVVSSWDLRQTTSNLKWVIMKEIFKEKNIYIYIIKRLF